MVLLLLLAHGVGLIAKCQSIRSPVAGVQVGDSTGQL